MARFFRLYLKKRGNRRTGSRKLGRLGETVFFGALLGFGLVGLIVLFVTLAVPNWKVNYEFRETSCVVMDKRIDASTGPDGAVYRPEFQIRYSVGGAVNVEWTYDIRNEYSPGRAEKEQILQQFEIGREYPCWYNPDDPSAVALVREQSPWSWLLFVIPISFILIGGGGFLYRLLHLGTTAERRAAIARLASRFELFDRRPAEGNEFPCIPPTGAITDSPGTSLAFRLPVRSSVAWMLFWLGFGCLLFNGVVLVFGINAWDQWQAGQANWWLVLGLFPFVAAGVCLAAYFVRQVMVMTGIGPTLIEVSEHPLLPGETYRMLLTQAGRLRIETLTVSLVSDEEAVYHQGTNTRREECRVFQRQVFRREQFDVRRAEPLQVYCDLEIPSHAMHSFQGKNNAVHWRLVVEGLAQGWPAFHRVFPIIVYPPVGRRNPGAVAPSFATAADNPGAEES